MSNIHLSDLIIGRYKIMYHNGVVQEKNLISHKDFIDFIKPMNNIVYSLDIRFGRDNKYSHRIRKEIKTMTGGDFFTDQSPIYDSINSGVIILPTHQGKHGVTIEKIH